MTTAKILSTTLLLLWSALVSAQPLPELPRITSDWSDSDTTRQTYLTLSLYADYAQTRSIRKTPGLWETNPILGLHPSDKQVAVYFIGSALTSYGIARALPAGWPRQSFQYGVIALQLAVIVHNKRIGMSFRY